MLFTKKNEEEKKTDDHYVDSFIMPVQPDVFCDSAQDFLARIRKAEEELGFRIFKVKKDSRVKVNNEELLLTMFSTEDASNSVNLEKLTEEKITTKDLSLLSEKDLKHLGCQNPKYRKGLYDCLQSLPNQEYSFDEICNHRATQIFNERFLYEVRENLAKLNTGIEELHFRLLCEPPSDLLMGEKYFASHYAFESLKELIAMTNEMEKQADSLKRKIYKSRVRKSKKFSWTVIATILAVPTLAIGSSFLYFRLRK